MIYDYDIVVVGAGPAGLSAALRARWLRTYKAVPASVAVVDPAGIGGLANWKVALLTGPSYALDLSRLAADLDSFPVDFRNEQVIGSDLEKEIKQIYTESDTLSCRSVVIASGLKTLCNERNYVGKGLMMTLKDHNYMAAILENHCEENSGRSMLIWGTKKATKVEKFVDGINRGRMKISLLIEPEYEKEIPGCYQGFLKKINGGNHIESVDFVNPEGRLTNIKTDYLLLDFESYMLNTNSSRPFEQLQTADGFIKVNHNLETDLAGVYAAGDITGPPFCAAKAMGEGVCAGFNAYRWVFEQKFHFKPSLYAFFPDLGDEIVVGKTGFKVPELKDGYCPKLLAPINSIEKIFSNDDLDILSRFDGKTPFGQLLRTGRGLLEERMASLERLVYKAIDQKVLAIHT